MYRSYPASDLIPKLNEGIFFFSKGQYRLVYQQARGLIDYHKLLVLKENFKHGWGRKEVNS
jgi:hypothetical protein